MKTFLITSVNAAGQRVQTAVSAATPAQARAQASSGMRIVSIKRQRKVNSWRRMSLSDRLIFMQRLASMLASKVGATEALDVMYSSFSGSVKEVSRIIKDRIANHGESFAQAMRTAGPRFFPETTVAIIETGSQGGDLAYAIREAARFEVEIAQVRKESGKGLFSALSGFVVGIATILTSTMYVAPEIMESGFIEAGGGADIGWIMLMADWTTYIALSVAVIVGSLLLLGVIFRPISPALVDRIVLHIPYYRDMVLAKSNYMVFFGLAVLLKAGLRVEEALTLSINNAPRGELRNDLRRARKALTSGASTPWPYVMNMLHPTDKASLATAQDREQIANTIEDLAVQYQALYRSRMETFVPALQGFSALFLSIAGFVLFGVSVVPLMQGSSNILGAL